MLKTFDAQDGCAFCRNCRGLGTGWVTCRVGNPMVLIPTADRDPREPIHEDDDGRTWVRESLADLFAPMPCFGEVE